MRKPADTDSSGVISRTDHAGLALLLAFGVTANLLEMALPRIPIFPWIRLGLAQIFTLAVIILYSPVEGIRFSVLRTLVAGFLSGMPLTSFLFSGLAGIVAAAAMGFLWWSFGRRGVLGIVGISVVGAVCHNLIQIVVAYGMFVKSAAFLWQLPWALLFSLVSGCVVGLLAVAVIPAFSRFGPIDIAGAAQIPVEPSNRRKALFVSLLASFVAVFFVDHWSGFAVLFSLLVPLLMSLRVVRRDWQAAVFRFWGLFFWIAATQLLFTPGRYLIPPITYEGFNQAFLLSLRLLFCVLVSVALQKSGGMDWALSALCRRTGSNAFEIVTGALNALPVLAATAKRLRWRTITCFDQTLAECVAKLSARESRKCDNNPKP